MNGKDESAEINNLNPPANAPAQVCVRTGFRGSSWCAVPWDVAGRIGLLFTVLCLIKLVMLAGFRKHLFEIHWRTGTPHYTWVNVVIFYAFAILVGSNLWLLG